MIEQPNLRVKVSDAISIVGQMLATPSKPLAFQNKLGAFTTAGGAKIRHQVLQEDDHLFAAHSPCVCQAVRLLPRRFLPDDVPRPSRLKRIHDFSLGVRQTGKAPREVPAFGDRHRALALKHARKPSSGDRINRRPAGDARLLLRKTGDLEASAPSGHCLARVFPADVGVFVGHNVDCTPINIQDKLFLAHTVLPDGQTVGEFMQPQIAIAYERGSMPTTLMLEGPSR